LLDSRHGWEAIKDRAVAHVRSRHDWAMNARDYVSVYHLLLAGGEQGGAGRAAAMAG
jgi:hypothetical protein